MAGAVVELWQYPGKSLQGRMVDELRLASDGPEGDRAWGLLDVATGKLASAKRFGTLLEATADDGSVRLPDGTTWPVDDPAARPATERAVSAWLGREVRVVTAETGRSLAYEMTFDPPDDDAERFDIPTPAGTLLDLAPVHLVTTPTLAHCRRARPDLDWDVRRFRPNLVVDVDAAPFAEDGWRKQTLRVGGAALRVRQPTVRCAMPLRAQPGGLARQPGLFAALTELNPVHPNHFGIYLDVVEPGAVRLDDPVDLDGP